MIACYYFYFFPEFNSLLHAVFYKAFKVCKIQCLAAFESPELLDANPDLSTFKVLADLGNQSTCVSKLNWTSHDNRYETLLELTTLIRIVQMYYPTFSAPYEFVVLESSWENDVSVLSNENLAIAHGV